MHHDSGWVTADQRAALREGVLAGAGKMRKRAGELGKDTNGWRVGSAFGDRAFFKGDGELRAAAAMADVYGNDAAEALYPMLAADADGNTPDCAPNRYTFPAGPFLPVNAFWSGTMYDAKTQLLVENPLGRLISSSMLPGLKKNADGSITLYLQKDSPGKDGEADRLPAPVGPIDVAMWLYRPNPAALDGKWPPPVVVVAK
ncbi:MAG TPA: DUF1214 domain-containing protein [Gemmataceae bacterium]|nr:DUF1214 domain-containing protein [Gemmataceae bacterium]